MSNARVASDSASAAVSADTKRYGAAEVPLPSSSVSEKVVSVASKTPAAALAVGTNADPKIPASKPAVVTAVTNLFFIDTIVSS